MTWGLDEEKDRQTAQGQAVATMKADYPIWWVPATREYILACIREEWRLCALAEEDDAAPAPTFQTTVHEWREAMDLVWWSPLGQALNKQWCTKFSEWQWFSALVPARKKTLLDVCNLLAGHARRPVVPPARILGRSWESAGVFLAIRSLLVRAGASPDLRPSTPLEPSLRKWPKVFLNDISPLAPGGLPFTFDNVAFGRVTALTGILGALLLLGSAFVKEPVLIILGVVLFALGWFGGFLGHALCPGKLTLENVKTFRGLTELIIEQQRRYRLSLQEV